MTTALHLVGSDGTVASLTHRLHFIMGKKRNWDGLYGACVNGESTKRRFEGRGVSNAISGCA